MGREAGAGAIVERAATYRLVSVLAIGLAVWLCSVASADAYIYWANNDDGDGTTISRANLDGSGIEPNFITGLDNPCGVAVDPQHIYWGNRGTNSIGRANLDGTSVDTDFITMGATVGLPCGPAVDGDQIWWANGFGGGGRGSIARANLDGSGAQTTFFDSPGSASSPISVALTSEFVFWANLDFDDSPVEPTIGRAGLDGTPPPNIAFVGLEPVAALWLAANESHFYAALVLEGFLGVGTFRANLDGTGFESVSDANSTGGLALDDARLYWANNTEGTISVANLDGSAPDIAFIRGIGNPLGLAVDAGTPPPANDFTIGKLKRNKRKGTAKLAVEVPGPGTLGLAGKGLRAASQEAGGAGEVELPVKAKGNRKRKLDDRGKLKLEAEVTFTPTGGAPNTEATKVKLVKN